MSRKKLERDPKIQVFVTTWSTGFIGIVGWFTPEQVTVMIRDLIDRSPLPLGRGD